MGPSSVARVRPPVPGPQMALFFNTAGGAWDNSKKYKPARTLYLSIRLIHVHTGTSKVVRMVGKDPIRTKQPSLVSHWRHGERVAVFSATTSMIPMRLFAGR